MRIVKLDINEFDLSGVDAIAFVENPAIEIDFLAFATECNGTTCHPKTELIPSTTDNVSHENGDCGCLNETETLILEGMISEFALQEVFVKQIPEEKYYDDLSDSVRDAVLSSLEGVALTQDSLEMGGYVEVEEDALFDAYNRILTISSTPDKPSIEDFGNFKVLYRYARSPAGERSFCVELQKLTARGYLFRLEDINNLSVKGVNTGFGLNGTNFYDIFAYKGGKNCRHSWERVVYRKVDDEFNIENKPTYISDRINAGTTLNVETSKRNEAKRLGLEQFASELEEQMMVATPIMVPDKLIPRLDEDGEKYYVYFTPETIKKIAYKFNKHKNLDKLNYEHDSDSPVSDVYLVENWLVEDSKNDKSNNYGYNVPAGTWFGLFKFENDKFWNDYVKTGKVKGVSTEGFFKNLRG